MQFLLPDFPIKYERRVGVEINQCAASETASTWEDTSGIGTNIFL